MSYMITAVFAAWIPATMILCRAIGPRRGLLVSLLAGFLLLPREGWLLGIFTVNKRTVGGLALLAGVLASDPKMLFRARPRLLDLPMIAFVFLPFASLAANDFADFEMSYDHAFRNFAEWSLPYLIGRLYFGDRDGPRQVAEAIATAGLLSIPIFAFEMVAGARWYLAGLVYGLESHGNMVVRLGGWRPEGFQTNGIEAGTWLALSSTIAAWLWLRDAWRPWKAPTWIPPLALSLCTIASRGVYGYLTLATGLATAAATHFLRTRVFLIALAILPPVYIGARASGAWDGQNLVRWIGGTGRSGTVAYRLVAEDAYTKKVVEHGAIFGFGGSGSEIFDFWSQSHLWPDGWWVHEFRSGGVVGLSAFFLAMFLFPAILGIALPTGRGGVSSPGAMARGLALLLLLHALDSLQNMGYLTSTPLIGGALVSLFRTRRTARPEVGYPADARPRKHDPVGLRPAIATVLILFVLEILGRMPRSSIALSVPTEAPATPASPDVNGAR